MNGVSPFGNFVQTLDTLRLAARMVEHFVSSFLVLTTFLSVNFSVGHPLIVATAGRFCRDPSMGTGFELPRSCQIAPTTGLRNGRLPFRLVVR